MYAINSFCQSCKNLSKSWPSPLLYISTTRTSVLQSKQEIALVNKSHCVVGYYKCVWYKWFNFHYFTLGLHHVALKKASFISRCPFFSSSHFPCTSSALCLGPFSCHHSKTDIQLYGILLFAQWWSALKG